MFYPVPSLRLMIILPVLCLFALTSLDEAFALPQILQGRIGQHKDKTRFVLDLSQGFAYRQGKQTDPNVIQIILPNVQLATDLDQKHNGIGLIDSFELIQEANQIILFIHTTKPAYLKNSFGLAPNAENPHRLVLDLVEAPSPKNTDSAPVLPAPQPIEQTPVQEAPLPDVTEIPSPPTPPQIDLKPQEISENNAMTHLAAASDFSGPIPREKPRRPVIVIDAGHGGRDPGALGARGNYEKNVTLAMAFQIREAFHEQGKYEVYLTRYKDEQIPLRKRFAIARKHGADLFLSLHADSHPNKKVKGLSVYTLCHQASDKEAARLAEHENKADIVAGIDFGKESKEVTNILIDLAQRDTNNKSVEFAGCVLTSISKDHVLSQNTHRGADFAVLKAPDIPSILIELGYLSNPKDEKKLTDKKYQKMIASGLVKAVDDYFIKVGS